MKIEYENKFSDILLFHAVHQFLSPVLQGFYVMLFVVILMTEHNWSKDGLVPAFVTAFVWYVALWLIQFLFNAIYFFSRSKSVLTKHTVETQPESFYEETKYNKSYFYWNGVHKVVRRPGFVAVYVTPHMAHVIPKRAFSSEAQMSSFIINECKNKLSAA